MVDNAFNELKQALTRAPILTLPNFDKQFVIECDVLGFAIGAVLMQEQHSIAFFSKSLHRRHLLLSTYEQEMMVLVLAVQKLSHYLLGRRFVVFTNHASLKFFWD